MRVQIDQDLIEESVHAAMIGHSETEAFHRQRESCYEAPPEERDARFAGCFRGWFERLHLARPIDAALGEQPTIAERVAQVRISAARRSKEQGVELFVAPPELGAPDPESRMLHIRVLAAVLADSDATLAVLRPELLHVADMLDPGFGYRPHLPAAQSGPTHDRMLLDRYSALWAASVIGRLVRAEVMAQPHRQRALARLARTFPMHAERAEEVFGFLLDGARPTHDEIVALAMSPRSLGDEAEGRDRSHRCSLCGCPTTRFEPADRLLDIVEIIRTYTPAWTVDDAVCPQCADLCRARVRAVSAPVEVSELRARYHAPR